MPLVSGTKLGPYEIVSPLGAGGMGEVYRARDTRLERTVAVKILPAEVAKDAVRRQRFEREAKTISSLNHPNICTLHDIGSQDGVDYLVMECVEGETLAKRLEKGPLPLEQVLKYGAQIADALDKAHRAGIVHRDLKPGNIMLTATGAKLLDFGLAKPAAPLLSEATLTAAGPKAPVTQEGTVVGTFQYMSPEQVEGKEVDGRSDIFSLGAVLYETVTGQRAFEGKSQLSVASSILEKEPAPINSIKPLTPLALNYAVRKCLAKIPEERWQSASDLASQLRWIGESGSQIEGFHPIARTKFRKRVIAIAAIGGVFAASLFGAWYWGRAPEKTRIVRSYIKAMPNTNFIFSASPTSGFALSPDGSRLAYVAQTSDGKAALWVRPLDSLQAQPLAGTENAASPFWSPDSRNIGFFSEGKLKRIEASGGPCLTLGDAPNPRGGTWSQSGVILFSPSINSPLSRISDSGGTAAPVTVLDASKEETTHRWPQFLPDGRHFLYLAGAPFGVKENSNNAIMIGSLDSTDKKALIHTHARAVYSSGHLLFLRQNALMAQPFDLRRMELSGDAIPIADQVQEEDITLRSLFSTSENGLLAYLEGSGDSDRELIFVDRNGKKVGEVPGPDAYRSPRFSPDGRAIAYTLLSSGGYDIWSYDVARGAKTRLTFGFGTGVANVDAVWSPDGGRIAYTSVRNGKFDLYQKSADGSGAEELLLKGTENVQYPNDWSLDGKFLAFHRTAQTSGIVSVLEMGGEQRRVQDYVVGSPSSPAFRSAFSPDGKWLAYGSTESGELQVYVVPFSRVGGKWQVSTHGGDYPRWRRDGMELFFLSLDNKIMAVEVKTSGSGFAVGAIKPLFETRPYRSTVGTYDVTPDGQRFVIAYEPGQPNAAITLVENWDAELKRK